MLREISQYGPMLPSLWELTKVSGFSLPDKQTAECGFCWLAQCIGVLYCELRRYG